jgi:NADH-quinone oxidoreductase subunit N
MGNLLSLFLEQYVADLKRSLALFVPELILAVAFVLLVIVDLIFQKSKYITGIVALVGFAATIIYMIFNPVGHSFGFWQMYVFDPFSSFFKFIFLISGFAVVLISFFSDELNKSDRTMGEYYTLILGMTLGMFVITSASNLILIYLALETMSLSSYVLAGYTKEIKRASEASLKYVIYGALSSGVMIYGISILYGLTGTFNLFELNVFLSQYQGNMLPLIVSALMILFGFGYKISAVPFHFWTPDVYEGSPVAITAYLSVASKAAGFAVFMRFLKAGFIDTTTATEQIWHLLSAVDWKFLVSVLSVLSMTVGNLVALWQTNVKRILAYSSIAHAGYMLMGVTVMSEGGYLAVMIYFFAYLFMNFGAFYVVQLIANKIGSEELDDYQGLGYRSPLLGTAMAIFLVSLTGLPPTVGFVGKLYIFQAVLNANMIWLAVIGVLNAVISLAYYAKIFRNMWLRGLDRQDEPMKYSLYAQILVYAFMVPTIYYGLFWSPIVRWAESSVLMFIGK